VGESARERRDAVIDELGGAGPPEERRERVDVGHPARDPQLDRAGRLERAVVAEPAEAERGAARLAEAEESFGVLGEGAAMRRTIYRSHAKKLSRGAAPRRRPLAPETRARHTGGMETQHTEPEDREPDVSAREDAAREDAAQPGADEAPKEQGAPRIVVVGPDGTKVPVPSPEDGDEDPHS